MLLELRETTTTVIEVKIPNDEDPNAGGIIKLFESGDPISTLVLQCFADVVRGGLHRCRKHIKRTSKEELYRRAFVSEMSCGLSFSEQNAFRTAFCKPSDDTAHRRSIISEKAENSFFGQQ